MLSKMHVWFISMIWVFSKQLQAVDVMQEVNGNEYRVGCTHCVLYESSGISLDWAHGKVMFYIDTYTD